VSGFCAAVLEDGGFVPGRGLVLDGIRHLSVLAALRTLIPKQPLRVVYFETSTDDRARRSSLSRIQLERIDSHTLESENSAIRDVADLVLKTSDTVDDCFSRLCDWATKQCIGGGPC
jgi:hypothetical protein